MRRALIIIAVIAFVETVLSPFPVQSAAAAGGSGKPGDGAILPFPPPPMGGKVGPTMQESVHKWREQPRYVPEDAPNILIVMFDDAGYGHPDTRLNYIF